MKIHTKILFLLIPLAVVGVFAARPAAASTLTVLQSVTSTYMGCCGMAPDYTGITLYNAVDRYATGFRFYIDGSAGITRVLKLAVMDTTGTILQSQNFTVPISSGYNQFFDFNFTNTIHLTAGSVYGIGWQYVSGSGVAAYGSNTAWASPNISCGDTFSTSSPPAFCSGILGPYFGIYEGLTDVVGNIAIYDNPVPPMGQATWKVTATYTTTTDGNFQAIILVSTSSAALSASWDGLSTIPTSTAVAGQLVSPLLKNGTVSTVRNIFFNAQPFTTYYARAYLIYLNPSVILKKLNQSEIYSWDSGPIAYNPYEFVPATPVQNVTSTPLFALEECVDFEISSSTVSTLLCYGLNGGKMFLNSFTAAISSIYEKIADTAVRIFPLNIFTHLKNDVAAASVATSTAAVEFHSSDPKIFGGKQFTFFGATTISNLSSKIGLDIRQFLTYVMYLITGLTMLSVSLRIISHLRREGNQTPASHV